MVAGTLVGGELKTGCAQPKKGRDRLFRFLYLRNLCARVGGDSGKCAIEALRYLNFCTRGVKERGESLIVL